MIRDQIEKDIKKALGKIGLARIDVTLERPTDSSHGDYSTNIALIAAKKVGKSSMDLAEGIKKKLEVSSQKLELIDKIEVVKPGFINFWLAKEYMVKWLHSYIADHAAIFSHPAIKGKRIMVEFTDPNPFKEFHIGHLRNITLGESLCRLLESQSAEVWRVNYQGDVGMHVAKALFGLLQIANSKLKVEALERKSLGEKLRVLGQAYVAGDKAYQEDEDAKKEIQALNLKIYRNDPEIQDLWQIGRKWSLDYFEKIYKRVGTKYRRYYFESEVAGPGREIVLANVKKGIFERHDGAVIFRGEKHGFHTRVFVTKEDYATYEAKDMALAGIKYKDFPYDHSIIITAHEQSPYFKVVLAAMGQVFPELARKTSNLTFGFVRLRDTKMSSRLGNIITGEWLLDETKARIKKEFSEMDDKTAEIVAVGAVKYSMLKFATASDISFSFEESINLEGNSGPYLQYTFARTQSVLAKLKTQNSKLKNTNQNLKLEPEEVQLLRLLHRFPEVVSEAAENFAPNLLCNHLFDLSQAFNLFYQKHSILNPTTASGRDKSREFRLTLTASVNKILKTGLYLLGIEAPERM